MSVVAAVLVAQAMLHNPARVSRGASRSAVARAAISMGDDPPTSYAEYMRRKQGKDVEEKLQEGGVVYDANADWQRTEGEGGKSTMAQDFASTDTPDYAPEGGDPRANIDFTEGMMGSQKAKVDRNHDPGISQALEINPEVIAGVQIDADRRVEFKIPEERWPGDPAAQLSAELDMGQASSIGTALEFEVEPVCMTYEDFYAGWTAESDPAFKVEPSCGRMDRKNGEPTVFKVTFKPDGPPRQCEGYLCVVLPDDGEQWTFKFTATAIGS